MGQERRDPLDRGQVRSVFVLVAHPDDESLWAGGLILAHPWWHVSIATLCRASDSDRAARFHRVCERLGVRSARMADLDDGPEQRPLSASSLGETIRALVPGGGVDLLVTHSLAGEYTRHLRHEEVGRTVARLWEERAIAPNEVWMFAYEDEGRTKSPQPIAGADLSFRLTDRLFLAKYRLITELYGFDAESWEARAVPRVEAFWRFRSAREIEERHRSNIDARLAREPRQ